MPAQLRRLGGGWKLALLIRESRLGDVSRTGVLPRFAHHAADDGSFFLYLKMACRLFFVS